MAAPFDPFPDNQTTRRAAPDRGHTFMSDLAERVVEKQARKRRLRPSDVVVRAATAELLRQQERRSGGVFFLEPAEAAVQRIYGACEATLGFVAKAAVNPAQTTVAGWAQELITTAVADFLTDGEPQSAFGELASRGLRVDEGASVKVPSRAHPLVIGGAWISEASPKPVLSVNLSSITLTAFKLCAISAWSDEIVSFSTTSIEALVRDALRHDLLGLIDQTLLGSAAATAGLKPAGLWSGATAVTPSAATSKYEAMTADLQGLQAAVSTSAPDAQVVFVVNPKQALPILGSTQQNPRGFQLIVSGYQTVGSVGAVDAGAFVSMLGDLRFQSSSDATVHSDSSPAAISIPGALPPPHAISAPTISLFQADLIGLRSTLVCSWGLRRSGATALCSSVVW